MSSGWGAEIMASILGGSLSSVTVQSFLHCVPLRRGSRSSLGENVELCGQ